MAFLPIPSADQISAKAGQLGERVVQNALGYATGLTQSWISNQLSRLSMKIPSEVTGILGYLLSDKSIDPLHNLMYRVRIANSEWGDEFIQGVNIPYMTFEYRNQRQKGRMVPYPTGMNNLDDLTIIFLENRDGDIASYWEQLRRSVYNSETGHWALPAQYATDIHISLVGIADGTETLGFLFPECRPMGMTPYSMKNAGGEFIQPAITWKTSGEMKITVQGAQVPESAYQALQDAVSGAVRKAVSYIGF